MPLNTNVEVSKVYGDESKKHLFQEDDMLAKVVQSARRKTPESRKFGCESTGVVPAFSSLPLTVDMPRLRSKLNDHVPFLEFDKLIDNSLASSLDQVSGASCSTDTSANKHDHLNEGMRKHPITTFIALFNRFIFGTACCGVYSDTGDMSCHEMNRPCELEVNELPPSLTSLWAEEETIFWNRTI